MKTMLDKAVVAGDITQPIDRRGAESVAVTVIGGTAGTAIIMKSSDTANGVYTDYLTIVSAADAGDDTYNGAVVDLSGAGKYIKITGAKMATAVLGDCDADIKKIAIVPGTIPQSVTVEALTATENRTYTEEGKAYSPVTVNVPSMVGTVYKGVVSGDANSPKFVIDKFWKDKIDEASDNKYFAVIAYRGTGIIYPLYKTEGVFSFNSNYQTNDENVVCRKKSSNVIQIGYSNNASDIDTLLYEVTIDFENPVSLNRF